MNQKQPTIWLDLTDLFVWEGSFTGIQRVAYNYAQRYSEEGAKFFIYSSFYKRFVEVPLEVVGEKDRPARTLKKKFKNNLKNNFTALPRPLQRISEPSIRKSLHWYRHFSARVFYRAGNQKVLRSFNKAEFQQNDMVVILGAGWNEKDFIEQVNNAKGKAGFKLVIHLNDILPVYQPQLFAKDLPEKFSRYIKTGLRSADKVLTISEASKKDIIKFCGENKIPQPGIEIIRLGEDMGSASAKKPDTPGLDNEFVLAVGTFEIRKNYVLLYQAVKLASSEGRQLPQVVIAGRKGWLTEDLRYAIQMDPDVSGKLIYINNASDENLAWLYDNCLFSIFPSVSEGWGLPIAESMHYGKLCLSSSAEPMPEIAGKMIDYFSPYDSRGCMDKIIEYYSDKSKLQAKTDSLKKNYTPFSWDDSFSQLQKNLKA